MDSPRNDGPRNPQSGLSSAEYRAKLLTKLNCLIAVLEVAIAKISRSIDLPGTNEERLMKIRSNLENTLSICRRAKNTLVKGLDSRTARGSHASTRTRPDRDKMSYRDYVELSSIEEYQKFKSLPPIKPDDIEKVDIDEIVRQLFDS